MCSGALYWSKIGRIVYGASDEKNGYRKSTGARNPFHPRTELQGGVLEEPCAQLMKDFFKSRALYSCRGTKDTTMRDALGTCLSSSTLL